MNFQSNWVSLFVGLFSTVFFLSISEISSLSLSAVAHVGRSYLFEFSILAIFTSLFLGLLSNPDSTSKLKLVAGLVMSSVYALLLIPLIEEQTVVGVLAIQVLLCVGLVGSFFVGYFWKYSARTESLLSFLALVLGVALVVVDRYVLQDQYFGVHEVILGSSFVALFVSIRFYYLRFIQHKFVLTLVPVSLIGLGLVCAGFFSDKNAVSEYRADSQLGKAVSSVALEREYQTIAGEFFSPNPVALFTDKSGVRPFAGNLEDYNVVFVLSETTRADETFLNNEKVNFTPNLKTFSEKSTVYENAIAPSSGTFQSVSSIFSMLPPTMAPIDLWSKHWVGELRKDRASAVETFQNSGWKTAWIGHDFHRFFSHDKVRGFDRGFDFKKLEPETKRRHSKKSDIRTAKRAVNYIAQKAKSKERFFLFTFFSAPHATYVNHFKAMPSKTLRESYRQEVSFVDQQFGKVLKAIEENGIEKKTIVIFSGDHGEAFGEHRTHRHNSQLYRESVHVPLAVYIPDVDGTRISKPVSLYAVLPTLMLKGPKSMRKVVEEVVKADLAPLYVAMGQGAFSELIRLKKMLTRIDLEDRVLIYDHVANRISRFEDHPEKIKLSPTKEDEALIDRLGRLRSTRKRFTKRINYSPWKRFKKEKKKKK